MTREQSYKGKLAVITGGGSGLGLALAHELTELGAKPVLIDITEHKTPYPLEIADVSDADALSDTVARIKAAHGPIDIAIANAAHGPIDIAIANAAIDITGEAHDFTADEWRSIIETNLIGATNLISAVYPDMAERRSGQLLFIASGAGLIGFPLGAPYTASKAGMIGMASALRAEAKRLGVSVCVACPPSLDTPLLKHGRAKPGIDRPAFLAAVQKTTMPADAAARHILRAARADKSPIIFPSNLRIGHKLATLFPSLGERIRASTLDKFDRHGRL